MLSYPTWQIVFTNTQFSKWRKTKCRRHNSVKTEVKRGRSPKRKYKHIISILLLIDLPVLVFSNLRFSGSFRCYWRKGKKLVKPASCVSSWETDISFHFCPYHFFTLNVSNYSVLCISQLTKCPSCSCIRYLPALQTKSRQCLPWGKRWSSKHLSPYVHPQHSVLIPKVATVSTSSPHKSSLPSRLYFNFSEGMWHTWENR